MCVTCIRKNIQFLFFTLYIIKSFYVSYCNVKVSDYSQLSLKKNLKYCFKSCVENAKK